MERLTLEQGELAERNCRIEHKQQHLRTENQQLITRVRNLEETIRQRV